MAKTKEQQYEELKADPRFSILHPPCYYCVHLTGIGKPRNDDSPDSLRGWTCPAFPEEIPRTILKRQVPHTEVFNDQHGVKTFESTVYQFPNGPDQITFEGEWGNLPKAPE